jgi:hypothetical protein
VVIAQECISLPEILAKPEMPVVAVGVVWDVEVAGPKDEFAPATCVPQQDIVPL